MPRRDSRTHAERQLINDAVREIGHCEECGATSDLQGHHKTPKSVDPTLILERSNIAVLCTTCHALKHPEISGFIERPRRKRGKTVVCLHCGAPKYVKASKATGALYCSRACNYAAKAAYMMKRAECVVCGTEFVSRRKVNIVCCSHACGARLGHGNRRGTGPLQPTVKNCATCSTPFVSTPSQKARFCSLPCFGASQADRIRRLAPTAIKSRWECREIPFS